MKPEEKTPEMENMLTSLFGVDRHGSITNNVCVICGKPAKEFRDTISEHEFTISGLCQSCQDQTFDDGY